MPDKAGKSTTKLKQGVEIWPCLSTQFSSHLVGNWSRVSHSLLPMKEGRGRGRRRGREVLPNNRVYYQRN